METKPFTVLISSRNPAYLFEAEGKLESAGYNVIGCLTEEDTELHIRRSQFDALVLGPDVSGASGRKIGDFMDKYEREAPVIEHEGEMDNLMQLVARWTEF